MIRRWRDNPELFAIEHFGLTLDWWQAEAFRRFPTTPRLAMCACAGPGKTMALAIIGWCFMLTHPHAHVGAASINRANLKANLWTELAKWRSRSKLLTEKFEQTNDTIFAKAHPKTWLMEARSWAQDADEKAIGNALRGLHGDHVMWLLDETGGYPESIMPVVENIFAGNPKEAHIVQAGNPTNLGGPLYRAHNSKGLWKVIYITGDPDSPKRSSRISVEHARTQIEQYGRDDPWVIVNIFGEFPPASFNALLSIEQIREAMARRYRQEDIDHAARIFGVDVARYGDDSSVIAGRQGLVAFPFHQMRNVNSVQGAAIVAKAWHRWDIDACFVDNTGGYGTGWIDQLEALNLHPIGVGFAEKALDPRYERRRSEMDFLAAEWIKKGGWLPEDEDLVTEASQLLYTFKGDKLMTEPKEMMKARIGRSPDKWDALKLTFAAPVAPRTPRLNYAIPRPPPKPYDPYASMMGGAR